MPLSKPTRLAPFLILAAAMLATRQYHFDILPDASWAVFFLGGFYLTSYHAFAAFMVGAVIIDYVATQHLGVSSYCLSPAYVFLLPSYAALWLGGRWAGQHWAGVELRSLVWLIASLLVSVSVCFLVSNGSVYWLSGRASAPTLAGWAANFRTWYPYFLGAPCIYVGLAVLGHAISVRWAHRAPSSSARVQQH
jgi:hypothetical protein